MANDRPRYLTVKETAERLRTAPQTVYRWCRTGKLAAVKIGKEWRIPADQLTQRSEPAGFMPLDALLAGLIGEPEHLLGLACDNVALARMEATFFDMAAANGARLVHTRWDEGAASIRRRLRPATSSAQKGEGALQLLEYRKAYEEQGVEGPARLLVVEIERAGADGTACCIFGSPLSYFGYHSSRLTTFESSLDESIRGRAALVLCAYSLNALLSLYAGRVLSVILEFMDSHSGVVWFDGQRALLQRPAGWVR